MDFNKILNSATEWIKNNKKMAILIGIVLIILVFMIIKPGNKKSAPDFVNTLEEISTTSHVADGSVIINGHNININAIKVDEDFDITLSDNDNSFDNTFVKSGSVIYLNSENFEQSTGLLTLNKKEETEEDVKSIESVILDVLSSCEEIEYTSDEETQSMKIKTTESWKAFWTAIKTALTENIDAIAAGYTTPDVVKELIQTLTNDIDKLINTDTIANTLEITIIPSEGQYNLDLALNLDISILPSFINKDDVDSNKFSFSLDIDYTTTDAGTVRKPSGSIHAATQQGVLGTLTSFWNLMFEKSEYISFNQVSVTSDCVEITRNLGNTTEIGQFIYNAEGINNALWTITSTDETVLDAYITKYEDYVEDKKDLEIVDMNNGTYVITIFVSQSGLNSINKISRDAKGLGQYFNSAKGGDLIV